MTDTTTTTAPDIFAMGGIEKIDVCDKNARELAAIEFDALAPGDLAAMMAALSEPEWSKTTRTMGIELRISTILAGKSKPELIKCARSMMGEAGESEEDENLCFLIIDRLTSAEQQLEALRHLIGAAVARMMSAVSVIAIEDSPEAAT